MHDLCSKDTFSLIVIARIFDVVFNSTKATRIPARPSAASSCLMLPRSTRIAPPISSIICYRTRRRYESKSDPTSSGITFCRRCGVLSRQSAYGHLETERGKIEVQLGVDEEQHRRLPGRGRQREGDG